MADYFVTPGDNLYIAIPSDFGVATISMTHAGLLTLLNPKKGTASKRSATAGKRISRNLGLLARAVKTGTWSNGVAFNQSAAIENLVDKMDRLPSATLNDLTDKGFESLQFLSTIDPTINNIYARWEKSLAAI